MRKVTQQTVAAFLAGKSLSVGNTSTDGSVLLLHGNKIAERREDGIYISLAGWNTRTTRERLNCLPHVCIHCLDGQAYYQGCVMENSAWYHVPYTGADKRRCDMPLSSP